MVLLLHMMSVVLTQLHLPRSSAIMIKMAPYTFLGPPLWWLKSWGWLASPSRRVAGLLIWWCRGPTEQKPKLLGLYMAKPGTGTALLHSTGHCKL